MVSKFSRWGCNLVIGLACFVSQPGYVLGADADAIRASMRARLALLRLRTVVNAERSVFVTGADSDANASLMAAVQRVRNEMESLIGFPVSMTGQSLRIQILPKAESNEDEDGGIFLESAFSAGEWIHRIIFSEYSRAYGEAAREAVVYSFLAACVLARMPGQSVPVLPPWLWQGVARITGPDAVTQVLDEVDAQWRSGQLPSLPVFLERGGQQRLNADDIPLAGAIVYWLATRPVLPRASAREERLFGRLILHLAQGQQADRAWLQEVLGDEVDEQFDRWLLAQRRMVRGVGALTASQIENLRGVLLLYPGQHGIPHWQGIEGGGPLHKLVEHREAAWFPAVVIQRRQMLQLAAQGRPARFREAVGQFVAVLDGAEAGIDVTRLAAQEIAAYRALEALADLVETGGGIWREQD